MDDSATLFQKRRAKTWALSKWWLLLIVVGFLSFALLLDHVDSLPLFVLQLVIFAVTGISIARVAYIVKDHYKCPVCDKVPGDGRNVAVNPRVCSYCGAKLR